VSEEGTPAKVSRRHIIKASYSGLIYVVGGKYTTYRKIAEDVVRRLTKKSLIDTQKEFPVYGSGKIEGLIGEFGQQYDVDPEVVKSLMDFYGTRFKDVLALVKQNPDLKNPICSCSPVIGAQIVYALQTEMARKEEDVIMRRLEISTNDCQSGQCRKTIRHFLSQVKL